MSACNVTIYSQLTIHLETVFPSFSPVMAALKSLDIVYASHHMRKLLVLFLLSPIVTLSYHILIRGYSWTEKESATPTALQHKPTALDKVLEASFGTTSAYRCDEKAVKVSFEENSKSQNHEDETLLAFFLRGICGGVYVELRRVLTTEVLKLSLFLEGFELAGDTDRAKSQKFRAAES